ncbi:golgi SNAP receptor complex member bos1 [Sistotremastrum niveocremeum HHB9708]|uniref:Protein transport protein BOS1 n=2 Tax=Sistotremastraceae TaxID=3402574 RepID=A0A164ZWC2_9AGAM|nr:golgi SNAP receptor complex member bos1 [Sistotremastrum niveocremeum HHB9708]KZT40788.1 V-snare-domain-containing protein [Sistotremastrum suecicum HHB10207 ss-3]
MNSLYTLGVRQTSSIQADLEKIRNGDSSAALLGQVAASLSALNRTVDNLDTMAKREMIQAKKEKGQMRVEKFRSDYLDLKRQLDAAKAQAETERTNAQRSELFAVYSGNPITPSDARRRVAPSGLNGTMDSVSESPFQQAPNMPSTSLREDHVLREHTFMQNANSQLDDFLAQGKEVLDNLVDQRNVLKGTHKRLLDTAHTLGLSRDVIGWIEKRSKQDLIIFCVGAVFTFFCFYWIWRWFG